MKKKYIKLLAVAMALSLLISAIPGALYSVVAAAPNAIEIPSGHQLVAMLYDVEHDSATLGDGKVDDNGYQTAVNLEQHNGHFDRDDLQEGIQVVVQYDSDVAPQLIVQNFNKSIYKAVQASSSDAGVIYFTYDDMLAAYGEPDFSELTNIAVQSREAELEVYRIYIVAPNNIPTITIPNGHQLVAMLYDVEHDSATLGDGKVDDNGYQTAVNLEQHNGHFDRDDLQEGIQVVVQYDSDVAPQLIVQNFNKSIYKAVQASSSDAGVIYFTYDDMLAAYGEPDFSELTNIAVQSREAELEVYRIYIVAPKDDDGGSEPEFSIHYSFEDGKTDGWGARGSSTVTSVVYNDAPDGDYVLKISNRGDTWHGASIELKNELEKGIIYKFTSHVMIEYEYADDSEDASVNEREIKLTIQQNPAENGVSYPNVATTEVQNKINEKWFFIEGEYSFNEDKNSILLYVESSDKDDIIYLDNVTITIVPPDDEDDDDNGNDDPIIITPISPDPNNYIPNADGSATIIPPAAVDHTSGQTSVELTSSTLFKALSQATADDDGKKTVAVRIPTVAGTDGVAVAFDRSSLTKAADNSSVRVKVETDLGTVELSDTMLNNVDLAQHSNVSLEIGRADTSALSSELQAQIAGKPVIELRVTAGGETIAWNNPASPVTVSIPYTPTDAELANPEHIVVWYIDGAGNVVSVPNGKYDAATGMVTFKTTHFSKYAVAYVVKSFEDITNWAWAKKAIEVMASKGVINGRSETIFDPRSDITRGDYMKLLIETLELNAEIDSNYADISTTHYYYDAIGIAKALGITANVAGDNFDARTAITRQDMIDFTAKAMIAAGKLGDVDSEGALESYTDTDEIASYARSSVELLVASGIIEGSDNEIRPLDTTTRAEAATLIYRIYNTN